MKKEERKKKERKKSLKNEERKKKEKMSMWGEVGKWGCRWERGRTLEASDFLFFFLLCYL